MNIAVVGSREFPSEVFVKDYLRTYLTAKDTVISGGARGVDRWAAEVARELQLPL